MEKNLDHLTSEEVETLMQRYYAGESVSKLTKEYGISVRSSDLYKLFPPEAFANYICEYCDEPLVINRPSKTMKNLPKYERDLYCPVCGHKPFQTHCNCENCQEEERNLQMERLQQIEEVYSKPQTPVDFASLSFENKVFLGAILSIFPSAFSPQTTYPSSGVSIIFPHTSQTHCFKGSISDLPLDILCCPVIKIIA